MHLNHFTTNPLQGFTTTEAGHLIAPRVFAPRLPTMSLTGGGAAAVLETRIFSARAPRQTSQQALTDFASLSGGITFTQVTP